MPQLGEARYRFCPRCFGTPQKEKKICTRSVFRILSIIYNTLQKLLTALRVYYLHKKALLQMFHRALNTPLCTYFYGYTGTWTKWLHKLLDYPVWCQERFFEGITDFNNIHRGSIESEKNNHNSHVLFCAAMTS